MKTIKLIAISLASIVLLSGCSSLRIGYYYADWYIVNKIDNLFDLNRSQEQRLDEVVDELHKWHQSEEVPRLIALLDQAQNKVREGVKKEDLEWLDAESNAMKIRILNQVADDVSELLTTLTDEQIDHLEMALVEHNEEEEEEYTMPIEEWESEQRDRILESLNRWFGDLGAEQEKKLLAAYDVNRADHLRQHQQSIVFQEKFVTLLRGKPSAEELKNTLSRWILKPESIYSPEYAEFRTKQEAKQLHFILLLDKTINDSQRQHAVARLESFQYDFEAIYVSSL